MTNWIMAGAALAALGAGGMLVTNIALQSPASRADTALESRLAAARGGERIVLDAVDYGIVRFPERTYTPALQIDARRARFRGIVFNGTTGVKIEGGTVAGAPVASGKSYGVEMKAARNVHLNGMTITGAQRGIVIGGGGNLSVTNTNLVGLVSEGINLTQTRDVLIKGNSCSRFKPRISTYDASGKRLTKGDHPDCIQAWSRPKAAPVSDIRVEDNRAEGAMQGIFFGNHIRKGIDDGGFDRIVIQNNQITVSYPNAIRLSDARDSRVTGNIVKTLPGGRSPRPPYRPNRAGIIVTGERNTVCGNRIGDYPRSPATGRCR